MEGIGALLIIFGVWCGYCSLNSFRPIRMAEAIVTKPSAAAQTLADASANVLATGAGSGQNTSTDTVVNGGIGGTTGTSVPNVPGAVQSNAADEQRYAYQVGEQMYGAGWNQQQMADLILLWNRESNWRVNAYNQSSGATGIPQALPGSKGLDPKQGGGPDFLTNPKTQINWGMQYIKSRYGSPALALAHENAHGWY